MPILSANSRFVQRTTLLIYVNCTIKMNGSHLIAYMVKLVGKCVLRLDRHRTAVHGNIEQSFSMHMALLIHVCWRKTSSFFILSRATTIYTTVARNVKDTCVFIPDLFSRPMLHCTCDVIFRDTV